MKLFEEQSKLINVKYKKLREELCLGFINQIVYDYYFSVELSEKEIFNILIDNVLDWKLTDAGIEYYLEFKYELAEDLFIEGITLDDFERSVLNSEDYNKVMNIIKDLDEKKILGN